MERAMGMDLYSRINSSDSEMEWAVEDMARDVCFFSSAEDGLSTQKPVIKWAYLPLWRMAWKGQDEANLLQKWNRLLEHVDTLRTNSWKSITQAKDANLSDLDFFPFANDSGSINQYDRLRFLFSAQESLSDRIVLLTAEAEVEQQMAVTAIAIQRYRLRMGHVPPDLQALVPDFLPSVPRDCMDGKPLRYRRNPDDTFILYSVGENGIDDGGNPDLEPNAPAPKSFGFWKGRDAVWPTAAPGS